MYVGARVFSDVLFGVYISDSHTVQYIIHDKNNIIQSYVIIVVKSKNSMKNYCIVSRYLLLGHDPHCCIVNANTVFFFSYEQPSTNK